MHAEEARQLIKYMAATWRTQLDDPEAVVVWVETLAPYRADTVRAAITELRTELDWMPTHRELMARVSSVMRRSADDRGLNPGDEQVPDVCARCEGTGWVDVDTHMHRGVQVKGAARRCECRKRDKDRICKPGCSCLNCHYVP